MRPRLRSFLLTSALTFAPAVASATTISGLYVDGGAGYNLVQNQHLHAHSSTGFTGFGAVGYGFGNGLRVEAEGLYNFSHSSYTRYERPLYSYWKTVAFNFNGTKESYGGFFNVLYDFDLERLFGVKSIVTPFIGGGAGYLWQRYTLEGGGARFRFQPNSNLFNIAWQGIVGAAFDTGVRGLQITAQYRIMGHPDSFFDERLNHQFIVGFRYAFQNQPIHHVQTPPPVRPLAAAAPAPVPARSYLVFFDWNQYTLTSRARQIVVEAAHATSYVHTTRINVNGYTDSSAAPGPAGQRYNYALSVKRARSVEAELIRNGVPASEIVIRGYGDTNPLVPTAPNTREPQNRRVEIILHA